MVGYTSQIVAMHVPIQVAEWYQIRLGTFRGVWL